jgi:hypothetical protein
MVPVLIPGLSINTATVTKNVSDSLVAEALDECLRTPARSAVNCELPCALSFEVGTTPENAAEMQKPQKNIRKVFVLFGFCGNILTKQLKCFAQPY